MKDITTAVANYLDTHKQIKACDLYKIVLKDGTTSYYAEYDKDVSWSNVLWLHNRFLWKREQIKTNGSITVDSLNVTIVCSKQDKIKNIPFLKACHDGVLDGAILTLYKAYFLEDGVVTGAYPAFQGKIEVSEAGGLCAKLVVKSEAQGLNQQIPIRIFAPQSAYTKNSAGSIVSSSSDTATAMIPLKPSENVLLRY